jgi:hypothetical protein
MRRCGNGHEVTDDGFQFCPICGERLSDDATAVEPETASPQAVEPVDQPLRLADSPVAARISAHAVFGEDPTAPDAPGRRWPLWWVVAAVVIALAAAAVIAGAVSGGGSGTSAVSGTSESSTAALTTSTAPAKACSSYKGAKPQSCISKMGFACSSYDGSAKPLDCLSPSQQRARVAARKAQAAAAKADAAAALKAAEAHDAYVAAANAWHKGYVQQDENVYWKWLDGRSCRDFATDGCWHVAVVTRSGCSSYVAVNANEYQGAAIVNQLLDNQGYGIPSKTERVFELDADPGNVTVGDVQIDCE